jgi:hypothetical protein
MKAGYNMLVKAVERAINEADPIGLLDLGAPSTDVCAIRVLKAAVISGRCPESFSSRSFFIARFHPRRRGIIGSRHRA